jgi:hypothetical protein
MASVFGATAGAESEKAGPGEVSYYDQVYSGDDFEAQVLEPAHARGRSLEALVLPDDSIVAVNSEAEMAKLMQEHYGRVPDGVFDRSPSTRSPKASRPTRSQPRGDVRAAACPNIHNLTARIWIHQACGGSYLAFFGDNDGYGVLPYGWNDETSTVQVGGGMDWVNAYWDTNFNGSVLHINGYGDGTDKNCGPTCLGTWHDDISSVKTGCSDPQC